MGVFGVFMGASLGALMFVEVETAEAAEAAPAAVVDGDGFVWEDDPKPEPLDDMVLTEAEALVVTQELADRMAEQLEAEMEAEDAAFPTDVEAEDMRRELELSLAAERMMEASTLELDVHGEECVDHCTAMSMRMTHASKYGCVCLDAVGKTHNFQGGGQ